MEEAKSELQIHPNHVVVPLAFFERVMEVYYSVKGAEVVGAAVPQKPPLQSPASSRPSEDMNLPNVEAVRTYVPPGYVPRGAAANTDKDDA